MSVTDIVNRTKQRFKDAYEEKKRDREVYKAALKEERIREKQVSQATRRAELVDKARERARRENMPVSERLKMTAERFSTMGERLGGVAKNTQAPIVKRGVKMGRSQQTKAFNATADAGPFPTMVQVSDEERLSKQREVIFGGTKDEDLFARQRNKIFGDK